MAQPRAEPELGLTEPSVRRPDPVIPEPLGGTRTRRDAREACDPPQMRRWGTKARPVVASKFAWQRPGMTA